MTKTTKDKVVVSLRGTESKTVYGCKITLVESRTKWTTDGESAFSAHLKLEEKDRKPHDMYLFSNGIATTWQGIELTVINADNGYIEFEVKSVKP